MPGEWEPNLDQTRAYREIRRRLAAGREVSLAGLAGTGKTDLIVHLPDFLGIPRDDVLYVAVANKAVHVLRQKAELRGYEIRAGTVFSHLYEPPGSDRHCLRCPARTDSGPCHGRGRCDCGDLEKKPRAVHEREEAKLIIADEASMIQKADYELFLEALGPKFLFVGDSGQLPPVNSPGGWTVVSNADVKLKRIMRQAKDSVILQFAREVRRGADLHEYEDGEYGENGDVELQDFGLDFKAEWEHFDPRKSAVIVWTNDFRRARNADAREVLLGRRKGAPLGAGDVLMSVGNDSSLGIFNGSQAVVRDVEKTHREWYVATLEMLDVGRIIDSVRINRDKLDNDDQIWERWTSGHHFIYGYAITCHKAQGSEWDDVLVYDNYRGDTPKKWR